MVISHRVAAALVLALAACNSDVIVAPVIESPPAGSEAAAFPSIDELELSLARAGDTDDLISATFNRGDTIELSGAPYVDDLVVHATGRLGGAEFAYGRTCAFDLRSGTTPPAPHLYFARTVKWADRDVPPTPIRRGGRAITYHDGSGVFVGGTDELDQPITTLDRFDPTTGEFTSVSSLAMRIDPVVVALGDGRLLLLGGLEPSGTAASSRIELIELDAAGSPVDSFDDIRVAREGATAVTLSDGRVLMIGGGPPGGPLAPSPLLITAGVEVQVRPVATASLAVPRRGATATRLSDDFGAPVLIAGGLDASNAPVAQAELWKPLREEFADPLTFHPPMRVPRSRHAAVRMPDGSVLIVGGVDSNNQPVRALELYTVDGGFADAGTLPLGAGVIDMSVTPLPDGRVLIAGGRESLTATTATANVYIARLDPLDGSVDVVATHALHTPRAGHAAAILCDGTVLVTGGTAAAAPAERYDPPPLGRR